ncbi:E3 ubiquitin/ISG15 ligase TRIM25 [Protobothrops mucrosquamatus]|uniref:E3 ubiquitin/ISG15 ligase TRIM25 n=1 Tax=Protobothrops mucrosquamatus TaxID=103944 RepID=UPI000775AED4|nr:E3 ubiquitin/ISG15 ligase TRIM25 [Protobothrops mucrosquamatus]
MASLVDALSMFGLEDELTCSICLCVFQTPVTTPCGHNFCLPCLEMTWMDTEENFSCPQCRASFEIRPDLKKNTVLCKVVEQFQVSQDGPSKGTREEKQEKVDSSAAKPRAPSPVPCDSCLVVEAAKTCLTCMASFCQEHLRPHLESPAFKTHQLSPPVKELQQKKCQTHNKLLEVFCQDHRVSICCFCLVSHKTCSTSLLQEAKETKKLQLKKRLAELCALSDKTAKSLEQVRAQQKQLSNTTSRKLELLKSEFLEIVALIHEEEKDSWKTIKAEEKRVLDKFEYVHTVLGKKKNEIQKERDEIEMTLTEMDDITFLKRATKLREVSFTDVFVPRIELDQNLLGTVYQKAFNLKELTKRFLGVPLEQKKKEGPKSEAPTPQPKEYRSSNVGIFVVPLKMPMVEEACPAAVGKTRDGAYATGVTNEQRNHLGKRVQSPRRRDQSSNRAETKSETTILDTFLTKSREELLEFATQFTLDLHTAHKNIILLEKKTKMSVTETVQDYEPHPRRFLNYFQVLSFQCYKKGIHYWEVDLENNNFCAVGICYGSIPRRGPKSRLGRNNSSWCIEKVNNKISAWHNDKDTSLPSNKATKIGVLLNYDGGFVIFFGVSEKKTIMLYKFKAEFTEAVYSAFWVFSSGTTISLCQLKS